MLYGSGTTIGSACGEQCTAERGKDGRRDSVHGDQAAHNQASALGGEEAYTGRQDGQVQLP